MKRQSRHVRLTKRQELALWRLHEKGDRKAFEKLVSGLAGFSVAVARQVSAHSIVPLEDLIQAGYEGLLEGLRRFDPSFGNRISTYVIHWIKAYQMKLALDHRHRAFRIPNSDKVRELFKTVRELSSRDSLSAESVAQKMGVKVSEARSLIDLAHSVKRVVGLDWHVSSRSDDPSTYGDLLTDPCSDPEQAAIDRSEASRRETLLRMALSRLSPRERSIMEARWLGDEQRTLKDVGEQHGITRERVRQLELRAKDKIRRLLETWEGGVS